MNAATVNVRHTAQRLGVHENTIRNYMDRGILKYIRLPSGVRRIPLSEVTRLEQETFRLRSALPEDKFTSAPPSQDSDYPGSRPLL